MRRTLAPALLSAFFLTGCLQSSAVVRVNADGSGTLENQTVMGTAALAQLRQFGGALGGDAKPTELFTEEQARAAAAQMGDGVTLVSSMPIATASGQGRASVYAFRDVTKLRVSQTPQAPGGSLRGGGILGDGAATALTVELTRTAAGTVLLTLHTPGDPTSTMLGQMGAINRAGGPLPADQLGMVRQMLAGMRLSLRVEPAGRLIRTNSAYVNGQSVTIFEVDMDALLGNEAAFENLQAARTPAEVAAALKTAPGIKVAGERDITIEFAP